MMEKFQAGMVLGATGDALGWRKGHWGGCTSGRQIQEELASLGGLGDLTLDPELWPPGDSALMHMTTAQALITGRMDEGKIDGFMHRWMDGGMEGWIDGLMVEGRDQ